MGLTLSLSFRFVSRPTFSVFRWPAPVLCKRMFCFVAASGDWKRSSVISEDQSVHPRKFTLCNNLQSMFTKSVVYKINCENRRITSRFLYFLLLIIRFLLSREKSVFISCSFYIVNSLYLQVMEKGPSVVQHHVLNIIYYFLHYVDMDSMANSVPVELLRVVTRFLDGPNWRECQNIIKLAVIRSSTLVPPGTDITAQSSSISFETLGIMSPIHFAEAEIVVKKELPGNATHPKQHEGSQRIIFALNSI